MLVSVQAEVMLPPGCRRHPDAQMAGAWDKPLTWECMLCTAERHALCKAIEDLVMFVEQYDGIGDDLYQVRVGKDLAEAGRK